MGEGFREWVATTAESGIHQLDDFDAQTLPTITTNDENLFKNEQSEANIKTREPMVNALGMYVCYVK